MAILGLHPLDVPRPRVMRAAAERSPESRLHSDPKLRLTPMHDGYVARLITPSDLSVRNLAFSVSDDGSLLIVRGFVAGTGVEYLVHHTSAVVTSPSHSRTLGHAPAGAVLRGSAPLHGWVKLTDGEGWLSDRFLEPMSRFAGRPRQFEAVVALPDDADVDSAEQSSTGDELQYFIPRKLARKQYRVIIDSRVAVRSAPNSLAPVVGVVRYGDVVSGTVTSPNWLKIGQHDQASYIMIKHPEYGELLQPFDPTVCSRATSRVNRVDESERTESRRKAATRTPSEVKAEHTSDVRATKSELKSTRNVCKTACVGGAVLQTNPVLTSCEIDAANVQRPVEQCEWWNARPDGSFSYVRAN